MIFDIDFGPRICGWLGLRVQDAGSANAQNKAADYSRRDFIVGFHCFVPPLIALAPDGKQRTRAANNGRLFHWQFGPLQRTGDYFDIRQMTALSRLRLRT